MLRARVAIVNFESGGYLHELLASLASAISFAREHIEIEVVVVVVDNGSRDASADACANTPLPLEVHRLAENVGFGAAANLALKDTREDWLLVMNADLLIPADFFLRFDALAEAADQGVAIIGPALFDEDGGAQPSVGRFPNLWRSLLGIARPRRSRKYVPAAAHRPGPVDWVTGACIAMPNAAWRSLDGFDERFFLYYEDVDLCRRAQARGAAIQFQPSLRVVHRAPLAQRSSTLGGDPSALIPVLRYSQLLYFRLHRSAFEFLLLSIATSAWSAIAALRGSAATRDAWRRVRGLPQRVLRGEASPVPEPTRSFSEAGPASPAA